MAPPSGAASGDGIRSRAGQARAEDTMARLAAANAAKVSRSRAVYLFIMLQDNVLIAWGLLAATRSSRGQVADALKD